MLCEFEFQMSLLHHASLGKKMVNEVEGILPKLTKPSDEKCASWAPEFTQTLLLQDGSKGLVQKVCLRSRSAVLSACKLLFTDAVIPANH